MRFDKTIRIRAPPHRIFPWLAPTRMARWDRSLVRAAPRTPGPLVRGAHFERVQREFGQRFGMDAEAVDVVDGRLFAWRMVAGDYEENAGAFELAPSAGGTRLRFRADVEFPYVMPRLVTEAELRRHVSDEVDAALFNLKDLVEHEAAS